MFVSTSILRSKQGTLSVAFTLLTVLTISDRLIYGLVAELVPVVAWSKRSADVGIISREQNIVKKYFRKSCKVS